MVAAILVGMAVRVLDINGHPYINCSSALFLTKKVTKSIADVVMSAISDF